MNLKKQFKMKYQYKILKELNFDRKSIKFSKVKTTIQEEFADLLQYILEELPRYSSKELNIKTPFCLFDNTNVPNLFILEIKNNEYLINTCGFNYCRYILKIDKRK